MVSIMKAAVVIIVVIVVVVVIVLQHVFLSVTHMFMLSVQCIPLFPV